MSGLYPGGGYFGQYSQGGSVPVEILIEPAEYVVVQAMQRWVVVGGAFNMGRRVAGLYVKDPQSSEPYGFDWTIELAALGETIATSTYEIVSDSINFDGDTEDPCALTLTGTGIVSGNLKTAGTLGGGTLGRRYTITNRIVTGSGASLDKHERVLVQNT